MRPAIPVITKLYGPRDCLTVPGAQMQTGSRRGPLRSEDARRLAGEARPLI